MILREARRRCQSQHRDARGQLVPNLRRYFHPVSPGDLSVLPCRPPNCARLRIRVHILLDLQVIHQV